MQTHVQRSVAGCFAVLQHLSINQSASISMNLLWRPTSKALGRQKYSQNTTTSVPSSVYHSLVVTLALSRLHYGNATLAGLRPACLTVSSLSLTRQLGRSQVFGARSILQKLSSVFTGCEHSSASSSNWRSLSTELFTALHLSTCQTGCSTSLIYPRDVEAGCAH